MKSLLFTLILLLTITYCSKSNQEQPLKKWIRPEVTDNGERIFFPEGSEGLSAIEVARQGTKGEFIAVTAPGRIVATVTSSYASRSKIILFETAELNATYAEYIHDLNALNKASKNLKRITDMYKNQVATEKDVVEAETELSYAGASLAESEGKLRAAGFNPSELQKLASNVAVVVSDIPEADVTAIKKGKKVKIHLTSFPELVLTGFAEAIGDNIDFQTRTLKVRISLPNTDGKFKPGMYGTVEFPDTERKGVVVANTAIVTFDGIHYLFVETSPGEFRRRKVITANAGLGKVQILEGLERDEPYVVSGAMLLKGLSWGY